MGRVSEWGAIKSENWHALKALDRAYLLQIGMGESVLHDNPLVGVEGQHLLKEVKGLQHLVHNMLTKQRCSQPPTVSIPFPP